MRERTEAMRTMRDPWKRAMSLVFLQSIISLLSQANSNEVVPLCPVNDKTCEIVLEIGHTVTMTRRDDVGGTHAYYFNKSGEAYEYKPCSPNSEGKSVEDISEIPFGDGSFKLVTVYNGSLPGPPIVVYRGQEVVIRLKNNIGHESTTLHSHGIHQFRTPWMDGVAGVSHCPINPGETFTYRFEAEPAGTHWYHSHHGTQRTMGAAGALIVLETAEDLKEERGSDVLPNFHKEFYMVLHDWMRRSSDDLLTLIKYDTVKYPFGYGSVNECYNSTKQADGVDSGVLPFVSALLNGRGRYNGRNPMYPGKTYVPFEIYKVRKGGFYRFRVIGASMLFSFRVSVDGHPIYVVATDGTNVKARRLESLIIFNGERYDFYIEATDPENTGNYWIRVTTLEFIQNNKRVEPNEVVAILRYDEAPQIEPESTRVNCTSLAPCHVLNCPFRKYPDVDHIVCQPVTDLRLTRPLAIFQPDDPADFEEHFLNFHFVWEASGDTEHPSINGVVHRLSSGSPQAYPSEPSEELCEEIICANAICTCQHQVTLSLGKVIQFNIAVTVSNSPGVINGNDHPVHIHGHKFQLLKTVYGTYDPVSKYYTNTTNDFYCEDAACNQLSWTNSSWYGGNLEGLTPEGAPLKDTLVVPVGGYVVVRMKTHNPGYWYMHCHVEFHNAEGMALQFEVGNEEEMNDRPDNLRTCGDFSWDDEEFENGLLGLPSELPEYRPEAYQMATIVLTCCSVVLLLLIARKVCESRLATLTPTKDRP